MNLYNIVRNMPYGTERRKAILTYLKNNADSYITINRKWCSQMKYDNDLKYLVKKNILKQGRTHVTRTSAYSYLKLV